MEAVGRGCQVKGSALGGAADPELSRIKRIEVLGIRSSITSEFRLRKTDCIEKIGAFFLTNAFGAVNLHRFVRCSSGEHRQPEGSWRPQQNEEE